MEGGTRTSSWSLARLVAGVLVASALLILAALQAPTAESRSCGTNPHVGENIYTRHLSCSKGILLIKRYNGKLDSGVCTNGHLCSVGRFSCLVTVPSFHGRCVHGSSRVTWRVGL